MFRRFPRLKCLVPVFLVPLMLLAGPAVVAVTAPVGPENWRTASRESAGIAPSPTMAREAIIQVYAARAFRWRGAFAVHSWIAAKPRHADSYTVFDVTGWGVHRNGSAVRVSTDLPDRYWYGARPQLIAELRGPRAAELIPRLENVVASYPYAGRYTTWPGPNSNTFVAHVLRRLPELRADLPPTAIGKDYLADGFLDVTPSGTGGQLSLFGLAGIAVGIEEGLEINLFGLNFGVDPGDFALRLPGVGKVGFQAGVRGQGRVSGGT